MFSAQYDTTVPEDQAYAKATPSAQITMYIDNPAALAQLALGEQYYFDISPVKPPEFIEPAQKAA